MAAQIDWLKQLGPTITPEQAREFAGGIGGTKFWQLIADGEFISFKVGAKRLVDTASFLAFLERLKKGAQPQDPRVRKMVAARAAKRAERAAAKARPSLRQR
jgi:hypothetical protein